MNGRRDQVGVHLDAAELGPAQQLGTLSRERAGAQAVISFAYAPDWVVNREAFQLDPLLALYEGEQYPRALPGIFSDCAPDRWGETLQERRESEAARREERDPRPLDEWDFLLGVHDPVRMGALRFSRAGTYVNDEPFAVPPVTRLRELEQLARETEEGLPREDSDEERWIAMMLAPGSSLGGARPKANFRDEEDGGLWIAKFPSREDRHDVGAWEYVVSRLAPAAGIEVPPTRLLRLGPGYGTFCTKHFDRDGEARRLYASAMTLSGRRDNEEGSYLDVARAIVDFGDPDAIDEDLAQLFRRATFNLLVGNRDDHLRNHGFLRGKGGWRLAPVFDVNPAPRKQEHSLAFDELTRTPDPAVLLATAPHYRLSVECAEGIVTEVEAALAPWPAEAEAAGLGRDEIARMATVLPRA